MFRIESSQTVDELALTHWFCICSAFNTFGAVVLTGAKAKKDSLEPHPGVDLSQVVVVTPALNEEESLPMVLGDLPEVARVFIVDNGSTDMTAQVAEALGAVVVPEPQRGYGAACLTGIAVANAWAAQSENPSDPVIVFVDADYSDHVDLLPKLVEPIFLGQHDFVLGSRLTGKREKGAMPPQSVFGNQFACALINTFFRGNYTDLGPFRALRLSTLRQLEMVDTNFGWTIEMQIKALKQKLRILELPVPYRCRIGQSKISGTITGSIKAGTKILYSIWKYA